eukprot:Gregarina_sp_Pseudo_9__5374@NODE_64_length_4638_cov_86_865188_g59_i0_p1_GENE_NODE_64_length_4638_cov_86_865188_g59_i0NODE_64_length_4638_cov_86_865188_g59_i0_p1_ORF_typecomplete_len309_score32_98FH2/PF02181_23/0_046_NODE_64_length_4638_cov_86_865188_g59_i035384464
MALICKDICRDCVPGQEYFEYGLWMPADKYRPDSDDEPSSEGDSSSGSGSGVSDTDNKNLDQANAAKVSEVKSKLNDNFGKVSGGSSTVTAAKAGDVARLLGFAPSQEEIRALKEAKGDSVSQADVEAWLLTVAHADDNVDHLVAFFQYYDLNVIKSTSAARLHFAALAEIWQTVQDPDQELIAVVRRTSHGRRNRRNPQRAGHDGRLSRLPGIRDETTRVAEPHRDQFTQPVTQVFDSQQQSHCSTDSLGVVHPTLLPSRTSCGISFYILTFENDNSRILGIGETTLVFFHSCFISCNRVHKSPKWH